jgi:Reverse transcriptase (RNA-dependent DNA polymerase)
LFHSGFRQWHFLTTVVCHFHIVFDHHRRWTVLFFFKDVNRIDVGFLQYQSALLDWDAIYLTPDVNEQVDVLTGFIAHLFEVCVPLRRKFVPDAGTPWMTLEIRDAIRQRDAMRRNDPNHRVEARRVTGLIRCAAARLAERNFDPALPSRVLWSNFRRMGLCKSSDFSSLGLKADDFANFFSNLPTPSIDVPTIPDRLVDDGFSFRHVDADECLRAFMGITSNAVGLDGISIRFLRVLLPFILNHVLHVFNHAITCSVFPASWKQVIVRPVAKVSSPSGLSDFRPISIVSVLSKGFERILHEQVLGYVDREGFLSDRQSGFRRGHSTTTALVRVTEDLRLAMVEGKVTVLALLDFSKAFDCVNHQLFLYVLATEYRFGSSGGNMISSFLSDRSMVIEVDGSKSSPRSVLSGVPQGSVPSPLFFSMFIDRLRFVLRHCNFHFYADDLQIYLSGNKEDIADIIARVNEDLEAIFQWSTENGLLLNPGKTQAMVVSNGAVVGPLPSLFLGGVPLEWRDEVNDLGLIIDSRLRFDGQVTKVCKKVYATLYRLRLLKFMTPKSVRLKLCKALLIPHFFYCDVIYSRLGVADFRRLEVAFNSCTRYVFGLRRFDHLSVNRNAVLGIPLGLYFDYRVLLFFFRLIRSGCPNYLFSSLVRARSSRTLNFVFPGVYHGGSVLARGIRLWNGLSFDIKESRSVVAFGGAVFARLEAV